MNSPHEHRYIGYTLVDITPTGVIRDSASQQTQRNQQRNWETVIQCISLLTQPSMLKWDIVDAEKVTDRFDFGEMYQGLQKVWMFEFSVERPDIFGQQPDPVEYLANCFDEVPVIVGLEESARFILPIFYTNGAIKNIYFNKR
jgi:hypothetical protein